MLIENNEQVWDDKAFVMVEDTYLVYKREIEGLEFLIEELRIEQERLSDPSSEDVRNSEDTPDFDSTAYVSKEIEIGVKIRDLERKLGIVKKRFQFIYGDEV